MTKASTIKFSPARAEFFSTLNQRVNEYFKSSKISRYANAEMKFKTVFMYVLYFTPYALLLSGAVTTTLGLIAIWAVMGLGVAGIGLSVMHDANHGSYSNKKWVNQALGYSLNLIGGNAFNWKVQHNVLHHTFTNIHEVDEDISPRGVLRMTPCGAWKPLHRFQHVYAWFLYGLLTLVWTGVKDYVRIVRYDRDGMMKKQKTSARVEWIILIVSKLVYFGYIFVIPMLVTPFAWWQCLIGFLVMQYVAGFILAIIFQPAHVIDGTEYPMPDDQGQMENNWAIHQLRTTTNFANNSSLFSWYVGGLNYQIEHHLFPNVCHVHYRKISSIVKQTAQEFNLPYKSAPTFIDALVMHGKLLKELGRKPVVQLSGPSIL